MKLDMRSYASVISMLRFMRFRKKTDQLGIYAQGNTFYYKEIESKVYLIFIHFPFTSSGREVFDCYRAVYEKRSDVGTWKPSSIRVLKLSFDIDQDLHLVESYLQKFKGRATIPKQSKEMAE